MENYTKDEIEILDDKDSLNCAKNAADECVVEAIYIEE